MKNPKITPVAIESPYAGNVAYNLKYGRACMADCIKRGEAPFASHLLYTQPGVLDDTIPEERELGIQAGLELEKSLVYTVVYTDLGTSKGMEEGIKAAHSVGREVIYRELGDPWKEKLDEIDELILYKESFDEALQNIAKALRQARQSGIKILNLGFLFKKLKEYSDRIQMNIERMNK